MALVIFLFGCTPNVPPTPCLEFSANIRAVGESYSLEAQLSSTSQGALFISVTTPDEIAGLSYSFKDELSISFSGLKMKSSEKYLPCENFAAAIKSVLEDLSEKAEFKGFRESFAVFSGISESGEYEALTDKDGFIKNISLKEINLNVSLDSICFQ